MMKRVRGLLLVALVCSITGSVLVLAKNGDHHRYTRIATSALTLLDLFFRLAKWLGYEDRQIAFGVVLNEESIEQSNPTFQPPLEFPTPNRTLTPANPAYYGNHLAAIPILLNRRPNVHAEKQILDHFNELITAFERNNNTVAVIVFYTHLAPCVSCTREFLAHLPHDLPYNVIVLYRTGTGQNINVPYTQNKFRVNNIRLQQVPEEFFTSETGTEEHRVASSRFCEDFIQNAQDYTLPDSFGSANGREDMCVDMNSRDEDEEEEEEEKKDWIIGGSCSSESKLGTYSNY